MNSYKVGFFSKKKPISIRADKFERFPDFILFFIGKELLAAFNAMGTLYVLKEGQDQDGTTDVSSKQE